jgi:hypothetical protein
MAVYFLWLQNERQNVHIYNQKLQIVNLQNVLEMTHKKLETLESKNNKINVIIPKSQEDLSTIIKKENETITYDKNLSIKDEEENEDYKIVPEIFINKDEQKLEGLKINIETKFETGK